MPRARLTSGCPEHAGLARCGLSTDRGEERARGAAGGGADVSSRGEKEGSGCGPRRHALARGDRRRRARAHRVRARRAGVSVPRVPEVPAQAQEGRRIAGILRSEEHTSELQSRLHLVCRLLLEKKKKKIYVHHISAAYTICRRPTTHRPHPT